MADDARFVISIACDALDAIFDDCDRYPDVETGGRLLGTCRYVAGEYAIEVGRLIDAGPRAVREPAFLLQDGDHQEREFRRVEVTDPQIEHLGSWHSHVCNGLETLSSGDVATYFRMVNHEKHDIDVFYALLVVAKSDRPGLERYRAKHFVFRRGDDSFYEMPDAQIQIIESGAAVAAQRRERLQHDNRFFRDFHAAFRPMLSTVSGSVSWQGPITLIDGSLVVVRLDEDRVEAGYLPSVFSDDDLLSATANVDRRSRFPSARHCLVHLERELNAVVHRRVVAVNRESTIAVSPSVFTALEVIRQTVGKAFRRFSDRLLGRA